MNSAVLNGTTVAAAATVSLFTFIDYSVFAALLLVSFGIGLYFGIFDKHEQTTEEYLQGGHKMKPLPIAISLIASQLSTMSVMTLPAEIYSYGWQFALILPGISVITLASNYLFIPVFFNNNIDNCYAYLEMRFCKTLRNIVTFMFLLLGVFQMPVFLFIPSLAYSEVTGQNLYTVNTIVCICCVSYTMLGGIKAVVWTDVVQAFVMVLSIVLVGFFSVEKVGGIGEVWDRGVAGGRIFAPDLSFDLTTRQTFWNVVCGTFVMWTCHISFQQSCVQRIVSLPNLVSSQRAMVYFCIGVTVLLGFNFFSGLTMFAYYYDCDPIRAQIVSKADKLVPRFVEDVAGHITGMPGVFISCVFSASLSTVSATMNSLAGIIYLDYIKPLTFYRHTERRANVIMKIIVMLFGLECIFGAFVVTKFGSLLQLVITVGGTINGAKFGVFTLGMLYPWANRRGGLYGVLAGMSVVAALIINTQIATARDQLHYEPLPTSIDGCSNETIPINFIRNATASATAMDDGSFAFYKISFMWYGPLGAMVTWIVGIIVSFLTGGQDIDEMDPKLFAPCVNAWLPAKYQHTQMKVMAEKSPLAADDGEKNQLKPGALIKEYSEYE